MSSANPAVQQDENATERGNGMPEWLDKFLEKTFFHKCSNHHHQRNEMNRYCITCNASACRHCIANGYHNEHKVLTIYRHVYQDVVPLDQIENHMDCSQIQTYKCNKKLVVSLNPLPHMGSGFLIDGDGACRVCRRKLTRDGRFCFCSISCKFQALVRRRERIQLRLRPRRASETQAMVDHQASTSQRRRKRCRKGVPRRATKN